jgi:hypothetical protein
MLAGPWEPIRERMLTLVLQIERRKSIVFAFEITISAEATRTEHKKS